MTLEPHPSRRRASIAGIAAQCRLQPRPQDGDTTGAENLPSRTHVRALIRGFDYGSHTAATARNQAVEAFRPLSGSWESASCNFLQSCATGEVTA